MTELIKKEIERELKNPIIKYPKASFLTLIAVGLFGIIIVDNRSDFPLYIKIFLIFSEITFLILGLILLFIINYVYKEYVQIYELLNNKLTPQYDEFSIWFTRESLAIFGSPFSYLTGFFISGIVVFFFSCFIRMPWQNFDKFAFLLYTGMFFFIGGLLSYIYFRLTLFLFKVSNLDISRNSLCFFEEEAFKINTLFMKLLGIGLSTYLLALTIIHMSPGANILIEPVFTSRGTNFYALFMRVFIFSFAAFIVIFFVLSQFLIHKLLKKFKRKNINELLENLRIAYDDWYANPNEKLGKNITQITQWIEHIRKHEDWTIDIKTTAVIISAILFPIFNLITNFFK